MHILMLNRDDVFTVPGGDTIQMVQTKAGLERLGVEVQIGSIQNTSSLSKFEIIHIFNWQQLEPNLRILEESRINYPPIFLSTIFWFHTGHWFDQAVTSKPLWRIISHIVKPIRARRIFESWQQIKFRRGKQGQKMREMLTVPARLLPNSFTELVHLETILGLKNKLISRSAIIPNGIVKDLYDPLPKPNQAFLKEFALEGFVIQVARIQSAKNQLGLIKALFDLSIPIVFVGQASPYEPDYVACCYEMARKRGNVYFLGSMSQEDLAGIYVLAGVHVLPSWRETPGLVSLEAAAAGCRIVSTSIGSAFDYFGEDAFYCDPRDTGSIRQAVLNALNTPRSNKLRNLVLEHYTWDIAAQKTLEAYQTVV
jgi:glycosyltransferase involved in cell wall biosynthesis